MANEKAVSRVPSISIKTVGYNAKELRKLVDGSKESIFLARVGGVVGESFTGESKNGEWTGLKGLFTIINKDEVAFASSIAFLPANITKKIVDQLTQGVVEVEFMCDIFVAETDKNASGYSYIVEPVMSDEAAKKAQTISSRVLASKLPLRIAAPTAKKSA